MAGFLGNPVARNVRMGAVACLTGSWAAVHSGGASGSELQNRQWIKFQPRGRDTIRMAVKYVNRNADGTFTTPTDSAHGAFVYPSMVVLEEPISDDVRVFIRAVQNGGTSGGMKVIVAEYN